MESYIFNLLSRFVDLLDWDPTPATSGILADFPNHYKDFPAGSHPAEILIECRRQVTQII